MATSLVEALDEAAGEVTSLFVARTGQGLGKALLDRAKAGRDRLQLWTFVANDGARRFYRREGFRELGRTDAPALTAPGARPVVAVQNGVRWPFDGEFWPDELTSYRIRIVDRCR